MGRADEAPPGRHPHRTALTRVARHALAEARGITDAALRNTTTGRSVPLLASLASALDAAGPLRRFATRPALRRLHDGLDHFQSDVESVVRFAATRPRPAELRWRATQIDVRLGGHDVTDAFTGETVDDTGTTEALRLIRRELDQARTTLRRAATGHRGEAPPRWWDWEPVLHHMTNVYGRRTTPGTAPLARLERLAHHFHGADLRGAADIATPRLGPLLDRIRWNDATVWPQEWRDRVREGSVPHAGGHLYTGATGNRR
ncbi:hypothetical protein LX16_0234 [Stackebrandtia albiflava]|uniref:Uncharacterized protein n=1 Tax=Stackebrandtia albiflava TaxID=406432 RepID=A0A562V9J2_9ACTN|nr:hypothetical protein [Stackebrandtia albiflava]TWJ14549.1 hypothetical protein LX16_0234 [Stackebrandtia albiflava]